MSHSTVASWGRRRPFSYFYIVRRKFEHPAASSPYIKARLLKRDLYYLVPMVVRHDCDMVTNHRQSWPDIECRRTQHSGDDPPNFGRQQIIMGPSKLNKHRDHHLSGNRSFFGGRHLFSMICVSKRRHPAPPQSSMSDGQTLLALSKPLPRQVARLSLVLYWLLSSQQGLRTSQFGRAISSAQLDCGIPLGVLPPVWLANFRSDRGLSDEASN